MTTHFFTVALMGDYQGEWVPLLFSPRASHQLVVVDEARADFVINVTVLQWLVSGNYALGFGIIEIVVAGMGPRSSEDDSAIVPFAARG